MIDQNDASVHWSFWLICLVGLVFNLMGCVNYVSQTNAQMVAEMPEVFRNLIESRPPWATGAFAIAVFGGALGSILLLLKKPVSTYVFALSLVGAAVAQIPVLTMANMPGPALVGGLSQILIATFFIWYSTYAKRRGWLGAAT